MYLRIDFSCFYSNIKTIGGITATQNDFLWKYIARRLHLVLVLDSDTLDQTKTNVVIFITIFFF